MSRTLTRRFYMANLNHEQFAGTFLEAHEKTKKYLAEHPECKERAIVEIVAFVVRDEPTPPPTYLDYVIKQ